MPRLDLTPAAKAPRVLNEAAIFACIRCGKPLGTQKLIETMLGKLAGHSMFAAPGALDRLRMCADCRVVDLIKNENSVDIRKLLMAPPPSRCSTRSRPKTRRAPSSTRCSRACTPRRRTRRCWR